MVHRRAPAPEPGFAWIACKHGRPDLFTPAPALAKPLDSLAVYGIREPGRWPLLYETPDPEGIALSWLDTLGSVCGGATDRAACMARVNRLSDPAATCPEQKCRPFAIVTAGDDVRRVEAPRELLAWLALPIDTASKAALMAAMNGLPLACPDAYHSGSQTRATEHGYEVFNPVGCVGGDKAEVRFDGTATVRLGEMNEC